MTASSYKVGTIELQFILRAILVKPGLSVPQVCRRGANSFAVTAARKQS
jgi:hypothetical protein